MGGRLRRGTSHGAEVDPRRAESAGLPNRWTARRDGLVHRPRHGDRLGARGPRVGGGLDRAIDRRRSADLLVGAHRFARSSPRPRRAAAPRSSSSGFIRRPTRRRRTPITTFPTGCIMRSRTHHARSSSCRSRLTTQGPDDSGFAVARLQQAHRSATREVEGVRDHRVQPVLGGLQLDHRTLRR